MMMERKWRLTNYVLIATPVVTFLIKLFEYVFPVTILMQSRFFGSDEDGEHK